MSEVVCVVGLGYVGLPLAVEFAKNNIEVIGFDIDENKIRQIKNNQDPVKEIPPDVLEKININPTTDETQIKKADFIIISVPTPLTKDKQPDMSFVFKASETVGKNLKKGAVVIYESTVYPGATEEECIPILEKNSGLSCGDDFKVGYSPERISSGDKEHTIDKIIKIVSGSDKEALEKISSLYKKIVKAGVYEAPDIKTAEAAKVIENTQRDLNIALMNELSLIFEKMNIDTNEVIKAASTKWNFHRYTPGLVGGHCISIDPHYLLYKAKKLGYEPKVILAGRDVNDYMATHIAQMALENTPNNPSILILGLAFKKNVSDTRNSRVLDVIKELKKQNADVYAYDPHVETCEGVKTTTLDEIEKVDCVILAVDHDEFKEITLEKLKEKMEKPVLIDVKFFYNKAEAEKLGFIYKCL